jgi:hypothetical protein
MVYLEQIIGGTIPHASASRRIYRRARHATSVHFGAEISMRMYASSGAGRRKGVLEIRKPVSMYDKLYGDWNQSLLGSQS